MSNFVCIEISIVLTAHPLNLTYLSNFVRVKMCPVPTTFLQTIIAIFGVTYSLLSEMCRAARELYIVEGLVRLHIHQHFPTI